MAGLSKAVMTPTRARMSEVSVVRNRVFALLALLFCGARLFVVFSGTRLWQSNPTLQQGE
jgi:hypothetical protein